MTVNIAGFGAGLQEGRVIVAATGAANSTQIVTVTLQIAEPLLMPNLLTLKFTQLFLVSAGWGRELRASCVVYKNGSESVGKVQLMLAGGATQEHTVPVGREVLVCGDLAYVESLGEPRLLDGPIVGARPLALKFSRLELAEPARWERSAREGCLVFKNIRAEANPLKVTLSDGSLREFSVAPGREFFTCSDVIHLE
ncbi:hypothetical protein HYR54_04075 [Candidatus Acetothermia bacterium]|nr:hypothetical protein [Candidatus Acetothermia bacterium]